MSMRCTATAYAQVPGGYLFVTASHCVSDQDAGTDDSRLGLFQSLQAPIPQVKLDPEDLYITSDDNGAKEFLKAEVVVAGLQSRGDDFAILRVKTTKTFETIGLGDESKEMAGNPVLNIAAPLGLGRQVMQGYISMVKLDRPAKVGAINWQNAMVLQIACGPGSSGSSVLSAKQGAIIAFLVGTIGGNTIVIPVSHFREFSKTVNEHKYQYYPQDLVLKDAPKLPE